MNAHEPPDDLLHRLASLGAPAPRASRAARTRARCHDAMARPRRGRARVIDAVLGGAVAVYVAAIVADGLRVLLR